MQQFNGYIAQVLVKLRTCVWCTRLRRAKNFRPWVLLVCGGLVFHCKHFFSCLNTRSVWVFAKKTGALAATGIVFQIQSDPFRCNVHSKGTVLSSHGIEGLLVQPVFGSVSSGVDLSLLVFCRQLMFFIVFRRRSTFACPSFNCLCLKMFSSWMGNSRCSVLRLSASQLASNAEAC